MLPCTCRASVAGVWPAVHTDAMVEFADVLVEAREKSRAAAEAAALQESLGALDAEIVELTTERAEIARRIARSNGVRGLFVRNRGDGQADEIELNRLDALIGANEARQRVDQDRLRLLQEASHGVELARAQLGVEMDRRTNALPVESAERVRLKEIAELREPLVLSLRSATAVAALSGELLLWVDGAEAADDGTDVLYVSVDVAAKKFTELQSHLQANALVARTMLKDRLEGFRAIDGAAATYAPVKEIVALAAGDHVLDHKVWTHQVRVALREALHLSSDDMEVLRSDLIAIDDERIEILSTGR